MFIKAKKHLGQHFLKDHNIALKIVNSLDYSKSKNVLEIGPGMGILTEKLIKKNVQLKVVEIDDQAVNYLKEHHKGLIVLSQDFLKLDLQDVFKDRLLLIGSLPYNISSQVFFQLLEYKTTVPEAVFMIQREVAERLTARPGTKTYGILSVLLQTFYDIRILFHVGPKVFAPPPNVNSSVVKLTRNDLEEISCDEPFFIKIVKQAFNQRRKTLRNSLKPILPSEIDISSGIFNKRPEQLTKEQFLELVCLIKKNKK